MLQPHHETAGYVNGAYLDETPKPRIRTASRRPIAEPCSPNQVGDALLAYLKSRFASDDIGLFSAPVENSNGWETHTYRFQAIGASLQAWGATERPLVLR